MTSEGNAWGPLMAASTMASPAHPRRLHRPAAPGRPILHEIGYPLMLNQLNRHLPVKGTYNVRDLGGYAAGTGETRWRRILRADGLHRLDDAGMEALVAEGVTTVIDLRHADELATHPNPFSANPAVHYHNVSLFDRLAPVSRNRPGSAAGPLHAGAGQPAAGDRPGADDHRRGARRHGAVPLHRRQGPHRHRFGAAARRRRCRSGADRRRLCPHRPDDRADDRGGSSPTLLARPAPMWRRSARCWPRTRQRWPPPLLISKRPTDRQPATSSASGSPPALIARLHDRLVGEVA